MSKRLNKRQQREQEELLALKAAENRATPVSLDEEDEEDDEDTSAAVINPFAALEESDDSEGKHEDEKEEEEAPSAASKKSKKKKAKKKKGPAISQGMGDDSPSPAISTPSKGGKGRKKGDQAEDPLNGLDEVDRALAELKLKYGEESTNQAGPSRSGHGEPRSALAFRNLLSVDPKNLDADAELRRFFGSKVIASTTTVGSNRHRPGLSTKARFTLAKPKPSYPPPTALAGLGMRELSDDEVDELFERRGLDRIDPSEKWYTFEHSPAWREVQRQFLGAVRSHDPNELMALLQVYPWHVDTLLQMSEVYRLQSDIGAASDFAERALYAFDRCLLPGFSVQSGASRLDFDRVENRPMFTGLHRIISYLGRRGCWVTAFNFAKLLFSLDPEGDPHGAAFWLDFLAVKSGNSAWLLSMLDLRETSPAVAVWHAYPGMAYARALAMRAHEYSRKDKAHIESTKALSDAIKTFPEVIIPLADKVGASIPSTIRNETLFQVEAGYTNLPTNVIHLLSHMYVARSEALWKEGPILKWLEETISEVIPSIDDHASRELRADALAMIQTPRDPIDESINVPLFICRHILCSEATSWLGFLPPTITARPFHAFDPLPPSTLLSAYYGEYFAGVQRSRRAAARDLAQGGGGGMFERFLGAVRGMIDREPVEWPEGMQMAFQEFAGGQPADQVPVEQRAAMVRQLVRMYETLVRGVENGEVDLDNIDGGGAGEVMPGAFPGVEEE